MKDFLQERQYGSFEQMLLMVSQRLASTTFSI